MKYKIKLVSTCFVEGEITAKSIEDAKARLNNPRITQFEIAKGNLYSSNPEYKLTNIDVVEPA